MVEESKTALPAKTNAVFKRGGFERGERYAIEDLRAMRERILQTAALVGAVSHMGAQPVLLQSLRPKMGRRRTYSPRCACSRPAQAKTCRQCGGVYSRKKNIDADQWAKSRYCSLRCCGAARSQRAAVDDLRLREIFDSVVEKTEGCWPWRGETDSGGYGRLSANGKQYKAHCLALEFDGRPVPKGMMGCHHCDNPPCVRPDHLYVGTAQTNHDDMMRRRRYPLGEQHANAKLTRQDVRRMRLLRQDGAFWTKLSCMFGVSEATAREAVIGKKTWAHGGWPARWLTEFRFI